LNLIIKTAYKNVTYECFAEKLPLVDGDGKVAGLVTLKDIMKILQLNN